MVFPPVEEIRSAKAHPVSLIFRNSGPPGSHIAVSYFEFFAFGRQSTAFSPQAQSQQGLFQSEVCMIVIG
jgi:hypothetical protein